MLLYLTNKMKELRLTDREFFKAAHQWCFNHCPADLDPDVFTFREHGVVPKYVETFLKHLQENGRVHKAQDQR